MTETRTRKHVVVLCHPEAQSFNAAVAEAYCDTVAEIGHEVVLRDLYRVGFDPVLKASEQPGRGFKMAGDVADEIELVKGADVFVFVYPIWFGTPPAMLKGYVERVLGAGVSHRAVRARQFNPVVGGGKMLSFTSSGTSLQWLEEQGMWLSFRHLFDQYLAHAFGLASHEHVHFSSIVDDLKPRFVEEHLDQVRQTARRVCGELLEHGPRIETLETAEELMTSDGRH